MTSIRPATAADMAAVADLWHEGWHVGHAGHVPDGLTAARTLEAFHARTPTRVADTTVALGDSGELLGFVMVVGDEVEQVFVGPDARGTGLAGVLLEEAERQVLVGGHETAWLAVVAGNARARAFYEKRGWRDEGDLPYEVTACGQTFVSPCRRYVKHLETSTAASRVYVDMVGDLFHAGHVALLREARHHGDWVVVGVLSDDTVASYKRRPIMTLAERVAVIESCRYVDEVVADAPFRVTEDFLAAHGITAVIHGNDLSPEGAESIYGPAVATGTFVSVPRTGSISTTQLIQRVLDAATPTVGDHV